MNELNINDLENMLIDIWSYWACHVSFGVVSPIQREGELIPHSNITCFMFGELPSRDCQPISFFVLFFCLKGYFVVDSHCAMSPLA